jgi:hypothetical protein
MFLCGEKHSNNPTYFIKKLTVNRIFTQLKNT